MTDPNAGQSLADMAASATEAEQNRFMEIMNEAEIGLVL